MEKIIVVDADKCLACHSCALACAVAHSRNDSLDEAAQETPRPYSRIILKRLDDKTLPLHCRHCEDAPCIRVCPTQAIFRASDLSPVVIDNQKCIGCNECILICPFGVIRKDKEGKFIVKCDLCSHRLEAGRVPACVEACPTRAIKYRTPEESAKQKRQKYLVQTGVCVAMFIYQVTPEACTKCGVCFKNCPSEAVVWKKGEVAEIVPAKCTKCGICYEVCKFDAIAKV